MSVTAVSFRAAYREFGDEAAYTTVGIETWLSLAGKMLDAGRWGDLLDHGTMLFVAHRCALQGKALRDARFGKFPGAASGPVASKGVDKVNISYDVGSAAEENAGHWNLTVYGQEYIRLARIMGAGPVQVGAQVDVAGQSLYSNGFYAGPYLG